MTGGAIPSGQASLPTANSTKSFWHSDPSKILLGHRTTASLPTEADIVIVGSGISGASAAYFLRQNDRGKDLNIVLLEAREACWGATGRNGGHCAPGAYFVPSDIREFELQNFKTLETLVAKHDIQCDWRSLSVVHSFLSKSMFDLAVQLYEQNSKTDPGVAKQAKIITKTSASPSLEDLRIPSAAGAIIQTPAASLWPYKLVAWILENLLSTNTASKTSFNLQTNTPATHLQKTTEGPWIVHTSRGMIAAKKVLLTTNAYTSHLLPAFSDLIVPVRGEMSSLLPPKDTAPGTDNPPLIKTYCFLGNGDQNINQDDYLVQRPFSNKGNGGEFMFGGGRSYAAGAGVGVSDDSEIDPPAAKYLRQELSKVLDLKNEGKELDASYEWSGIMGYSRDEKPWVGEVGGELGLGGGEGLWICAGFTGHGMPNACLSGKAAADMMMGASVEDVFLPASYKLTKDRVEMARMFDEVHIADANGFR
ncbi:FAD dependent oxidoreductase-like protein [Stipitochalara longipes BDJ]|nr:FAD dependent oxidoreductase-like protein [Stipitochalara longipes BDJ]